MRGFSSGSWAKRTIVGISSLAMVLGLAACSEEIQNEPESLMVFGASSTRVLNEDMQDGAEKLDPELSLSFNNAGSSTLVQQLVDDAPADVLITASAKTMNDAVAAGVVWDPRTLATNSMVMVVPADNPAHIQSIADLSADDTFVVCDPAVPCGALSTELLSENGLQVKPDSLEHQVADVLGKVTSGSADAGWVYSTDAAAAGDAVRIIEIPGADKHRNDVVGAVVQHSSNQTGAQAFVDMLTNDFDSEWTKHGFAPAD